ncbi:MAG: DUF2339 domain-containing protein, partial [Spirochaetaceae bacterium]|nr:DUF2339 domain-containing protein [Spirochaetaceae bacterium]
WFLTTLFYAGLPAPLPRYVPLLHPLEIQQTLCAAVLVRWVRARLSLKKALFLGDALLWCLLAGIIARLFHFSRDPLSRSLFISPKVWESAGFHLTLFIFSSLYGITHLIAGHRLKQRPVWIAGAALTVAAIGKLLILDLAASGTAARIVSFFIAGLVLLFIGYAAPCPPPPAAEAQPPAVS